MSELNTNPGARGLSVSESGAVVPFVEEMLHQAVACGASDVHIEKYPQKARLRYRLDGVMNEISVLPLFFDEFSGIATRVRLLAGLDITERRLPQDGRFSFTHKSGTADIRVSIVPTIAGERIVLRILDNGAVKPGLSELGMSDEQSEMFHQALQSNQGMILVTGPTGSGKTTTLYAAVQAMNAATTNILTVEDPVEYRIDGIGQVEVKESIGLGFSEVLRAFLRQDPEVILVGEIRDYATADIAVKAALTGHLVMSTLHTSDAAATIARLINIGLSEYLIAAAVQLIVCQRLVRKLCPQCKQVCTEPVKHLPLSDAVIYKAAGCEHCHHTGYAGRCAVYEMVTMTEEMRRVISAGKVASADIAAIVAKQRISSLRGSGLALLRNGVISPEEYIRVLA